MQASAFCESNLTWAVGLVERLVRLESPSDDKQAVDRCGTALAAELAALGADVRIVPSASTGDHLLASFGPAEPRVLWLGHLDTVWPVGQLARMPLRQEGGRLFGPGVFDMKGGLGIALLALRALAALAPATLAHVALLVTGDEETGAVSSRELILTEARRSEAVLVLEPSLPGGALKTARKGCGTFQLTVRGREAHAGIEPERGANAVLELSERLLEIDGLQRPDLGTSLIPTIVHGGTRTNVVPGEATASIDARAWQTAEAERVTRALAALRARRPGTSLTIAGGFDRLPLERSSGVIRLFEMAREVAADLGQELAEGSTGGASDGNLTAALGVSTLDGLGAVGDGAHASHEQVEISGLASRAALVAGLTVRLAGEAGRDG